MVLETTIALIAMSAVLVMFHEWGHFIAARLVGIRVEEFAFGWGPKVARLFTRGGTEYTLHPVPLGGFVKLAGMNPGEEDIPDGFQAQAIWKRMLVIFAGPFMSLVLAALVFVFGGIIWGFPDFHHPRNRVGQVQPQSEAARIGLRAGDKVIEINGVRITKGVEMTDIIHGGAGKPLRLVVDRRGEVTTKTATPQWNVQYLGVRWSFMRTNRAVAQEVAPRSVASKAGIQEEDVLAAINSKKIIGGEQMAAAIKASGENPVTLSLLSGGKAYRVTVKPSIEWVRFLDAQWLFPGGYADGEEFRKAAAARKAGIRYGDALVSVDGKKISTGRQMLAALRRVGAGPVRLVVKRDGEPRRIVVSGKPGSVDAGVYESMGLLGFQIEPSLVKTGFAASVAKGLQFTWGYVGALLEQVRNEQIGKSVGGPLLIASMTASSVALGPYWVFTMMGALSLSLAFINLLPIPVLDGGHLAILVVEAVRRKRLTPQQMAAVQMAGLAIIGAIIVLVVFSDITKIAGGKVPQ